MKTLYNHCASFVQNVCLYRHTQTRTLPFALLELLSKLKKFTVQVSQNQFLYNCTQNHKCIHNQLTVQVYTKPFHCTSVHKTNTLYKFTQNQFTVQVYTKLIYCTSLHKTSLLQRGLTDSEKGWSGNTYIWSKLGTMLMRLMPRRHGLESV